MHSISTSTFLGRVLTATQERAGLWAKYFSYSVFISCGLVSTGLSARRGRRVCWSTYGEVGHVGDEDHGLDNLGDGGASLGEDSLEVLAALGGLGGDVGADKGALSGEGDGARAVDGEGGLDGLGLQPGRRNWLVAIAVGGRAAEN